MIIIYHDQLYTQSATSSATGFPATNVATGYPQEVWKAGATSATFTCYAPAMCGHLAAINVRADGGLTVTVTDTVTSAVLLTETFDLSYITDYSALVAGERREWKNIWISWNCSANPVKIEIALTDSTAPAIGCLRAGAAAEFTLNPKYGLAHAPVKAWVRREMNDTSFYLEPRQASHSHRGQILLTRADEYWKFTDICDGVAGTPLAVLLVRGLTAAERCRFTHYGSLSYQGSHDHYRHSSINFTLEDQR